MDIFVDGPLSADLLTEMLNAGANDTGAGAQSTFIGRVRADKVDGKQVGAIEYSGYEAMAVQVALALEQEARDQYGIRRVAIRHARGEVKAGEVSIAIVVDAAHRKEAFRAVEYLIDELKKRFPAWKKEIFTDGTYRWIGQPGSG